MLGIPVYGIPLERVEFSVRWAADAVTLTGRFAAKVFSLRQPFAFKLHDDF